MAEPPGVPGQLDLEAVKARREILLRELIKFDQEHGACYSDLLICIEQHHTATHPTKCYPWRFLLDDLASTIRELEMFYTEFGHMRDDRDRFEAERDMLQMQMEAVRDMRDAAEVENVYLKGVIHRMDDEQGISDLNHRVDAYIERVSDLEAIIKDTTKDARGYSPADYRAMDEGDREIDRMKARRRGFQPGEL